jgi:surface antigen
MSWGQNDYPWAGAPCGENNPANCNYAYRNCTDFAMWRIRHDLGLPCMALGNAGRWLDSLEELGYPVDQVPQVHDVMILEPGEQGSNLKFGHVAMVLTVGAEGTVLVEQYDWLPCEYDQMVFKVTPKTHFVHLAPKPAPPIPPVPTPTEERMFWIAITPQGNYQVFEDHTYSGISTGADTTALAALKACYGQATISQITWNNLRALAPTPTAPNP